MGIPTMLSWSDDDELGNEFGYRCSACGSAQGLAICAHIGTALTEDGSDPDGRTPNHDHYWEDHYEAACMSCGWFGKVSDLGGNA